MNVMSVQPSVSSTSAPQVKRSGPALPLGRAASTKSSMVTTVSGLRPRVAVPLLGANAVAHCSPEEAAEALQLALEAFRKRHPDAELEVVVVVCIGSECMCPTLCM